jgi:hypothetical protein
LADDGLIESEKLAAGVGVGVGVGVGLPDAILKLPMRVRQLKEPVVE